MTCEEARIGLYALLDGELDVAEDVEVLAHVEGCTACQRECDADGRLKGLLRDEARSLPAAPPDLWRTITQAMGREAAADRWGRRSRAPQERRFWTRTWGARPVGAIAALVMVVLAVSHWPRPSTPSVVAGEIVTDHVGSLTRSEGPVDVASSDAAAIREWLGHAVPFVARVPTLAVERARLLGGSVCHLGSTRGIRLTYALETGETLSFYHLERTGRAPFPRPGEKPIHVRYADPGRGPGALLWADERFVFALVAELSPARLEDLAARL